MFSRGTTSKTLLALTFICSCELSFAEDNAHRFLYVAVPGIGNDLKFGGHGILVFDIDNAHKFFRRIPTHGIDEKSGKPRNVKGVCASSVLGRIYVSTPVALECIDLLTEKSLWEIQYDGGCDRMSISQDSKFIYLPSFEKGHWHVIDPLDGKIIAKVEPKSGAHNTLVSLHGSKAFLGGLHSKVMAIADCKTNTLASSITFSDNVRPFTMNGDGSRVYACVNNLLGFEIGDAASGKMIQRVAVEGYTSPKVAHHGCPSHGIALSPDEKEIWVSDGHNKRVHIFDMTVSPPKQKDSVLLRDEPGWVTFSIDGTFAYPSTGDVIDTATRKVVAELTDETGAVVQSEKLLEIDFTGGKPSRAGDQFGFGRKIK